MFLDEQLPIYINYGASFKQSHSVSVHSCQNGDEFRRLLHPFVRLDYEISYEQDYDLVIQEVHDFIMRANGNFRAFRLKDLADYSTNNFNETPTRSDQRCVPWSVTAALPDPSVGFSVVQLCRWYGDPDDPYCARRYLRKPVAGSVLVSEFDGVSTYTALVEGVDYTIDMTTGLITLDTPRTTNTIYAGCEFDVPCRFDGNPSVSIQDWATMRTGGLSVREVFNP